MGHAIHFLERLPRIGATLVQDALSLYYSSTYTRAVISLALPDPPLSDPDTARVAIALDDSPSPPFIIASREGRMITCLAPGMSPYDTPVIDYGALCAARARQAVLEDRASAYERLAEQGQDFVTPLMKHHWGLSREHFRGLSFLAPWLQNNLFRHSLKVDAWLARRRDDLSKTLRRGQVNRTRSGYVNAEKMPEVHPHVLKRARKDLLRYWSELWSATHTMTLACIDQPEVFIQALERHPELTDAGQIDHVDLYTGLLGEGFTPQVLRVIWILGRLGEHIIDAVERAFLEAFTFWDAITYASALTTMGLRYPDLRARALAFIHAAMTSPLPHQQAASRPFIQAFCESFAKLLADPDHAESGYQGRLTLGRAYLHAHLTGGGSPPDLLEAATAPDPEADRDAHTLLCLLPTSIHFKPQSSEAANFLFAPTWLATASAEDFYPSARVVPLLKRDCAPLCAGALLGYAASELRVRETALSTPPDPRAPARNAPCPCKSGKKYKQCCLHKAG
jgi:hypothetical protein